MSAAVDFETRRFQTAAAHYLAGRPPYPEALIARTVELVGLGPEDRLMDLGCGPGQLAYAFAPRVGQVLAIDPEPAMLEEARAYLAGLPNVEVRAGRSDDLTPAMGRFKAAVIGRAFHWMDREQTLAALDAMIAPGGAVVLFGEEHIRIPENVRAQDYNDWLESFSDDDTVRRHILSGAYRRHTSVLLDSPFSRLEQISIIERRRLTLQELADRALSLSSTSRARLGDKADAMLEELARRFEAWEEQGPMEEVLSYYALIARR
jgi:precorrin-6B methylase 2